MLEENQGVRDLRVEQSRGGEWGGTRVGQECGGIKVLLITSSVERGVGRGSW